MTPDQDDEVVTASAYVQLGGRFVFMVGLPGGPGDVEDRLGVARLGGHREVGETPWACAAREVLEESSLHIRPLEPPATYWIGPGQDERSMEASPWSTNPDENAAPLLVARRDDHGGRHSRESLDGSPARMLSLTYLALAEGIPAPAAETQGLLLLLPDEVRRVARERLTLGAFLEQGGSALLRAPLPLHLPLVPLTQLRALAILLDRHAELVS